MKHNILIFGLVCEFFICLYVPMRVTFSTTYELVGYNWLWKSHTAEVQANPDITRLILSIIAMALLTTICYIIANKNNNLK